MARKPDNLIGRQFGPFKLTSLLGKGGMATVYAAEHVQIGKRAAIKVLSEDMAAREKIVHRFFNEASAVNEIGHENIVDIVDFGESEDGRFYFVMELLEGEPLKNRLRGGRKLGVDEAAFIVLQVASALQAAHEKGIVHRDLKPDNIFLTYKLGRNDYVKVLDFGVAKLADDGSGSHTRTGLLIGTPKFMSPEQTEGAGIDHRSDIWALGVILYRMLAGVLPFDAASVPAIIKRICFTEPKPLKELVPDLPNDVVEVVEKALQKDPDKRFMSMGEMSRALSLATGVSIGRRAAVARRPRAVSDGDPTTLQSGAIARSHAEERRGPLGLGVIIAVAAALLVAVGSWAILGGRGEDPGGATEGAAETVADSDEAAGPGNGADGDEEEVPWDDPDDEGIGAEDGTAEAAAAADTVDNTTGLSPELVTELLHSVDISPCATKFDVTVHVRGRIARDGVPFRVRAAPGTPKKLADCVVTTIRNTEFPTFVGSAPDFDEILEIAGVAPVVVSRPRAPKTSRPAKPKTAKPKAPKKTAMPKLGLDD